MRFLPVICSGLMIREVIAGDKDVTRRVMRPQPELPDRVSVAENLISDPSMWRFDYPEEAGDVMPTDVRCPFGTTGDILWCRETFGVTDKAALELHSRTQVVYRASMSHGHKRVTQRWRPSIYMPRWAARLFLRVTSILPEPVQAMFLIDIHTLSARKCLDNCRP